MHFTHIISDTHFHHAKIMRLGERPFASVHDMNEALIANWNARVSPKDTVLHLGDFAHDDVPIDAIRDVRRRLNGKIIMTLGNHDLPENLIAANVLDLCDLRFWFRSEDKDVVYSHAPMDDYLLFHGRVSVHGHTHGPRSDLDPVRYPGAISMNCELIGYAPLPRADLEKRIIEARLAAGLSWAHRHGY